MNGIIFLVVVFVLFQNVVDNNNENNNLNGNETNVSNKEIFTISKETIPLAIALFIIEFDKYESNISGNNVNMVIFILY